MSVSIRNVDNVVVIDLEGNLIMGEPADSLLAQVRKLLAGGTTRIAINLAGLKYLDSSGLGALAATHTSAEGAGALCRFFGAPRNIRSILEIIHLDEAISLLPNETDALMSFGKERSAKLVA